MFTDVQDNALVCHEQDASEHMERRYFLDLWVVKDGVSSQQKNSSLIEVSRHDTERYVLRQMLWNVTRACRCGVCHVPSVLAQHHPDDTYAIHTLHE